MHFLNIDIKTLESLGGIHTAREIAQQPAVWRKIWSIIQEQKDELSEFLSKADFHKIILTGAGTSAYIGESLTGTFFRHQKGCTTAIPTTNLVSHPYDYFSSEESLLMISFARSGNSPESKAAVELADKISKKCYHLIITCNPVGELATYHTKGDKYILKLPEETNDKSLAMTSSYTGMLLAGLLVGRLNEIEALKSQVEQASKYAERILESYLDTIKEISSLPFKRAVFLGSGPLLGTATESQLKLQELTDGAIICKEESFLGFRHGPKAVVDEDTLIVYLLSNNKYVCQYELDLIFAMEKGKKALSQVVIAEHFDFDLDVNFSIQYTDNGNSLDEDFLSLPSILPGQLLGFFKSLDQGLQPDEPSSSGAISRVVQGVNIYILPQPTQNR
ncbi:SIS domain-containing protein [Reichenbachiella agarivorans]|uniref:SIS domain-containing protein n=1 Tax=Reichenbachiella agarivorans TaxID=2979464 RepID=A0ABY6CNZ8_9BACT|nr:SIS domain-containing protein [Reichenbachiella agarivorans]UXP32246.1 SIS domain-containing protein [Reichenbachiella agarivorans]